MSQAQLNESTLPLSATLLRTVERQFTDIAKRIAFDIKDAQMDYATRSSFVAYRVEDNNGKYLSESHLHSASLTLAQLEGTKSFKKLKQICDKNYYRILLEPYLDYSLPGTSRLIKITVDGW